MPSWCRYAVMLLFKRVWLGAVGGQHVSAAPGLFVTPGDKQVVTSSMSTTDCLVHAALLQRHGSQVV